MATSLRTNVVVITRVHCKENVQEEPQSHITAYERHQEDEQTNHDGQYTGHKPKKGKRPSSSSSTRLPIRITGRINKLLQTASKTSKAFSSLFPYIYIFDLRLLEKPIEPSIVHSSMNAMDHAKWRYVITTDTFGDLIGRCLLLL